MSSRNLLTSLLMLIFVLSFSACRPVRKSPLDRVQQTENLCVKHPFLRAYQCSFDKVQSAAQRGDANAQYALGYLYYYGIGVLPNDKLALQWIQAAANGGSLAAQRALTLLYSQDKKPVKTRRRNASQHKSQSTVGQGNSKIACTSNKGYTIQIAGSQNLSKLRQFAQEKQRYLKIDTFVYRKTLNNKPWFVLTYGYYPTYAEARRKLNSLSPALKSYQPWVKSCASLLSTT